MSSETPESGGTIAAVMGFLKTLPESWRTLLGIAIVCGVGYYVFFFKSNEKPGQHVAAHGPNSPAIVGDHNTTNITVGPTLDPNDQDDDGPPPPLSFDIPDLAKSSGLQRLTDEQRKSPYYKKSNVVVANKTDFAILVRCSFQPRDPDPNRLSQYVTRDIQDVLPGESKSLDVSEFGGPVYISIFSKLSKNEKRQWYATQEGWVDLGVVRSRLVEVKVDNGRLRVKVYEEK